MRITKTENSIRTAFIMLLKQKPYERITISDIVKLAVINRNTFYLHYMDKEDLLKRLMDNCIQEMTLTLNLMKFRMSDVEDHIYKEYLEKIVDAIQQNVDLFRVFLNGEHYERFYKLWKELMVECYHKNSVYWYGKTDNMAFTLDVEYRVSGFLGVLIYWINNTEKLQKDHLISLIVQLNHRNNRDKELFKIHK